MTDNGETASPSYVCTDTKKFGKVSYDVFRNYKKCVLTGTFDPFTEGHAFLVRKALEQFDFVYICILVNPDKEAMYSVETREKLIRLSLAEYKKRIKIEFFDGMTVDYCKKRGIKYIIRGVRNEKDAAYEKEMAEYNKKYGDVETIIFAAERKEISSTEVKRRVKEGLNVEDMVSDDVISLLKTED